MATIGDPTELLARNAAHLQCRHLLVVDPPRADCIANLRGTAAADRVTALVRDFRLLRALSEHPDSERHPIFDLVLPSAVACDRAVVYLPKGKRALAMTLAMLAAKLPASISVLVVGALRDGIKSAGEPMSRYLDHVTKLDSARHCAVYRGHTRASGHCEFDLSSWEQVYDYTDGARTLRLAQYPGVFSDGHLDDGTAHLLRHMELNDPGRLLDMGCGCGIIGATAAVKWSDCRVDLVDSAAAALWATNRTLAINRLERARCFASDLFSEVSEKYDVIVTNPPFHEANRTDSETSLALIRGAAQHLHSGGSLQLVANRFLPYRDTLAGVFTEVKILFEDGRYRVYKAQTPRQAGT